MSATTKCDLLPPQDLIRTGLLDQGSWNYRPGPLGPLMRHRYTLACDALDDLPCGPDHHVLEIGYGSGIFLPELARRFASVTGVDPHRHAAAVGEALHHRGVRADLIHGRAEHLPLPDHRLDVAVAVSCLEFIDDLDGVCAELRRVLRPGGYLVVVTRGPSPVLDVGMWLLSGEQAGDSFQGRRHVVPTLERWFDPVSRRKVLPGPLTPVNPYQLVVLRNRD